MSLKQTLLQTSLCLGSVGLVSLAALDALQVNPVAAAGTQNAAHMTNPTQGGYPERLLSQAPSQGPSQAPGPGQGMGQGPGQGPQNTCQGPRQAHLAQVAAQLGVTESALRSALGIPNEPPPRPDLAAAAAQLGVTEDALQSALRAAHGSPGQGQGHPGQGQGHPGQGQGPGQGRGPNPQSPMGGSQ